MAQISFQVVEGLEAGRVFEGINTPLTIGREEDNDIQLNDERISRFHAKVQNDAGRVILTDLDSTNGTRVNGHPVRMRVLRPGDLVMVGRCVLLVGGPDELERLSDRLASVEPPADPQSPEIEAQAAASDYSIAFPDGPPPVPTELTAVQAAELTDLLEYVRTEILAVLVQSTEELVVDGREYLRIERAAWHQLEQLAPQIARYQRSITNPAEE